MENNLSKFTEKAKKVSEDALKNYDKEIKSVIGKENNKIKNKKEVKISKKKGDSYEK